MDNACIRLKFSPCVNNVKNSKCCLDIVPEVSCTENFDKINWKDDANYIEYSIPIVYKIVISKPILSEEPISNKNIKAYYSCVDFHTETSLLNGDIGSGDVIRYISDVLLYKKSRVDNSSIPSDICRQLFHETNNELFNDITQDPKSPILEKIVENENSRSNFKPAAHEDKIKFGPDYRDIKGQLSDSVQCGKSLITPHRIPNSAVSAQLIKMCTELKKLSVTPICTINTNDSIIFEPSCRLIQPISFTNTLKSPESIKTFSRTLCYNSPLVSRNMFDREILNHPLNSDHDGTKPKSISRKTKYESTQIRIAELKLAMENEILPLKLMIDQIMYKCSYLGLKMNCCNTSPVTFNQQNYNKSNPLKLLSNRVVYSYVYEG